MTATRVISEVIVPGGVRPRATGISDLVGRICRCKRDPPPAGPAGIHEDMAELDGVFYKEIVEQALREFPNEACGLIAAEGDVPVQRVSR